MNFAAWIFLPILGPAGAFIHAIICLCRTDKHRMYSKPARRRLRYDNHLSANTQAHIEMKAVEPEPEPAPVIRAIAEPPPAPVESAPTEPIAKNPSATSSSTSVSSSDVEEETAPAPAPLQRTATVPLQRTATAPPARAATAKKEDDPFKDPNA
ncbi:uncharacterized protein M421DRAFT_416399 [Didymella exigua CBS 183.55]|uniref:Uncharacterized protein n=1 Tax=Didymella exigua CBS 183.55 TaxID=1150837 RepID=A0A6A5RYU3_9PLEO|nr:uncharacterized protein M421DRAFT_416399 [Didymella exigua CBS 183.55]KAF1932783.1 hypothetical protein M421DRAFT_416399 [Didymella exigua CBS 183.55]